MPVTAELGLIVNPIAGMGGRVGLKGTDGDAYRRALELGARMVAPGRAVEFLKGLPGWVRILTAPGLMGELEVREAGLESNAEVLDCAPRDGPTAADHTRRCAALMADKVSILVFVGGDGTARDVVSAVNEKVVILGVPSGVKMYSGVFAETPALAARAVERFLGGEAGVTRAEVVDIDEEAFRADQLRLKVYGTALVPDFEGVVTSGKDASTWAEEELMAVADYFVENMRPCSLYLLGPGTTIAAIARRLGVKKTLLGVDAVHGAKLIGADLNEAQILRLLDRYHRAYIVVSPISGQGFIFGRGNQQLSPEVIRRVGTQNVIIVAARTKAARLRRLRVDTGDPSLDDELRGYRRVIVGYHEELVMRIV